MGQNIGTDHFTDEHYSRFTSKVQQELEILRQVLTDPDFGAGDTTVGAELEFYIVDQAGRPALINDTLFKDMAHPQLQHELNQFNIEYNLSPQKLAGQPFTAFEQEIGTIWTKLNHKAEPHGAELIPIGILPTLKREDFSPECMTDLPRYRALDEGLRRMRNGPFEIHIEGEDALHIESNDVTLEGANTSFQFHWRVPSRDFVRAFNAVQLVTPLTVALAANSPFLFHRALWAETRISLFKQSIDVRPQSTHVWRPPSRVDFGPGWVRQNAIELFDYSVSLFPPLLPYIDQTDALEDWTDRRLPELNNLKLHHGTTWTWNRAIYDHHGDGHLRIELRALPAGPTLIDMMANAAFTIGCAMAIMPKIDEMVTHLPFKYAEHNFYAAARSGLQAQLIWPKHDQVQLCERSAIEIAHCYLNPAFDSLLAHGVTNKEVARLKTVIANRLDSGITGASWQRTMVSKLEQQHSREAACAQMFDHYRTQQKSGRPVSDWSTAI
ncbi:hypothetical protein OLMES_4123 [Oleiphilus messinensis]|uniref:Glutamate--cysteine ligase n=1 Tax=Oleiphilus messinensis TaxID=141451 RepID=A0A1Y0ID10_9GAMM|nr:hypothetical protein [Oleiphilus messinensis]ARU58140.1 hypothetical protein OLMES_4123 [Oleiphilus messinensis]